MEFSFSNNRWLSYDEIQSQQQIKERNALGFHIPGMWDKILDINKCWLQEDPSNEIRNKIKEFATKNNIPFFDPKKQKGVLRTLMIRISNIVHSSSISVIRSYQEISIYMSIVRNRV